jgi:hypothetical protein
VFTHRPVEPRRQLPNTESPNHFVQFHLDVNFWALAPPDARTARPTRCPVCEAPGERSDGRVVLHGHGVRVRRLRGPVAADGKPTEFEVLVRRYACQRCRAVITVGPRGLLPRRRYTAMAIALALWVWAIWLRTDAAVRKAICPVEETGLSRPERWTTLRRWSRAARDGELWPSPAVDEGWSLRRCARRVVQCLRARGDPDAPTDEHRIFSAAAHAR